MQIQAIHATPRHAHHLAARKYWPWYHSAEGKERYPMSCNNDREREGLHFFAMGINLGAIIAMVVITCLMIAGSVSAR